MASSAPNGSSMSMMRGSCDRQRAICTRCCMPPDSWVGKRSAAWERPIFSTSCATRASRCAFTGMVFSKASATLPETVRQGSRALV